MVTPSKLPDSARSEIAADALRAEQVRLLYARTPIALAANLVIALIFVAVQGHVLPPWTIISWSTFFVLVLSARALLYVTQRRAEPGDENDQIWLRRLRIGVAATGTAWGLAGILMFPAQDIAHQTFLIFALAGMTAGAITTLGIDLVAVLAFTVPALTPLIARLFAEGTEIPVAMAATVTAYLFFTSMIALRTESGLRENVAMRMASTQREQTLQQIKQRLEFVVSTNPVVLYTCHATGDYGATYISENVKILLGLDPEQFTSDSGFWASRIHPDDVSRVVSGLSALFKHDTYTHEYRFRDGHDAYRWMRDEPRLVRAPDGTPLEIIGGWIDITERVRAEESRKAAHDNLLKIASQVPGMVYQFRMRPDGSLHLPFASDAIRDIFGLNLDDVREDAARLFASIHPDDHDAVLASIQTSARDLTPWQHEFRIKLADGTIDWLLANSLPQREADGAVLWHGFVTVGTERKRFEQELIQARDEANHANEAKSQFLTSMSHELRTPMNAILGFAQLLDVDRGNPMNPEQKDNVRQILRAGNHLLDLITKVLDLSQIEGGQIELLQEPVALSGLIHECAALVQPLAEQQQLELHIAPDCAQGHVVHADRVRLRQTLLNLLSNAVNYNRRGGSIFVASKVTGNGFIRLSIRDTGSGIAPDRLPHLFRIFERDEAMRFRTGGTGIGLVLSKRLIEAMGGRIGVESIPDTGSEFWIELPRTEAPAWESQAVARPHQAPDAPTVTEYPRILYVEDDPTNLLLIRRALMAAIPEATLYDAHTGELGVELAIAYPPHLILLDITLPGIDGYEVLRRLRKHPATYCIPVVAITANATPGDIKRGVDAGFTDYITKPFDMEKMLARVRELLDAQLARRVLYGQKDMLERKVTERTRELRDTRLEIIRRLGRAAEFRYNNTSQHVVRMSHVAAVVARAAGWSETQAELLLNASPLHDIGKIGIPEQLLLKPDKLDAAEWEIMKSHTVIGAQILEGDDSELLALAREIALTHHEKWDGSGYPNKLSGEDIPISGRIAAISDVFDTLTINRPYNKAVPVEDALQYLKRGSGGHFEPALVTHFFEALPEILEVHERYAEPGRVRAN